MMTANGRSSVEVEIENLEITGYSSADRYRITQSFENELSRLIEQDGLPQAGDQNLNLASLDVGRIAARPGASPASVGAQAARTLFRGLVRAMKGEPND